MECKSRIEAERQVSGAADSGSEARADAVCRRLQTLVRPRLVRDADPLSRPSVLALPRMSMSPLRLKG